MERDGAKLSSLGSCEQYTQLSLGVLGKLPVPVPLQELPALHMGIEIRMIRQTHVPLSQIVMSLLTPGPFHVEITDSPEEEGIPHPTENLYDIRGTRFILCFCWITRILIYFLKCYLLKPAISFKVLPPPLNTIMTTMCSPLSGAV